MKHHLHSLVSAALAGLAQEGLLPDGIEASVEIQRSREKQHGDFACNLALGLAKLTGHKPRELAQLIKERLPRSEHVEKVEIAGPGFINFFMTPVSFHAVVLDILDRRESYGRHDSGKGRAVQVEFVSANPNGPLHVGHGRGAAIGDCIANLLAAVGFHVQREYYVNDAGRQMDILAVSAWLRYLERCGEQAPFPANGYKGSYVHGIAQGLMEQHGRAFYHSAAELMRDLPPDAAPDGSGDKEAHIDALIVRAKALLGAEAYREVFNLGLRVILSDIQADLRDFGVNFDSWYKESCLVNNGKVQNAIERLKKSDDVYLEGGAWWFRSTAYGDEKDRVVVRENGQATYFASDIAYHLDKLEQRVCPIPEGLEISAHPHFDRIIDVWGADHHGYVPRIKAALTALGKDAAKLDVVLVQFAILYRGGERVQMSTRSGEFVTLRELRNEVGNDAARFFYVMRKSDQHLDFDLDLAKSHSNENPVYYVQYAHARICSVLREAGQRGLTWNEQRGRARLPLLIENHEQALLETLSRYPEVVESAALAYEPHQIAYYVRELATDFHTYYNAHTFLVDSENLRDARLALLTATRQVLCNALGLLGVTAVETM